jgi:hypothetical protein
VKRAAPPNPLNRLPCGLYRELRAWLLENDPDASRILNWSTNEASPPQSPEDCAGEIIWIILCAGRSAQAARTLEQRVWEAIHAGKSAYSAFGYRAKADAIDRAWRERVRDFTAVSLVLSTGDLDKLLAWCRSIPFVGEDTQFQLAKNFGADLCKPDIWLSRLAGFPDRPRRASKVRFPACMALCKMLGESSGDRIAAVDSLLWLACNKAVLRVDQDAGPVTYHPVVSSHRSIYAAAEPTVA